MKKLLWILFAALLPASAFTADARPGWAYLFPDANPPTKKGRTGVYSVPGSAKSFTQAQIDDLKNPPDWFPDAHPPAPRAVSGGDAAPFAWACGSCHLMSGMGHPQSASLAGKPAAYLMRRMAEYRSGAHVAAPPPKGAPPDLTKIMMPITASWPEADVNAAVKYFASLQPLPWIKVVETDTVPKSYISGGHMRVPLPRKGTEPLGRRIVELPQDLERALLRDPRSGTVAYVPVGAIERGKALVTRGAVSCAVCHGQTLKGLGDVPGIAGRSPVYTFRQLYLFKSGARTGPSAELMKASVAAMSETDMIEVVAYLATLAP